MLAALGAAPVSETAPAEFVVELFDSYANRFDEHLVKELEYRTPEYLNRVLRSALGENARSLHIIDLGCGTGLCGPLLRDIAASMVGVDLSPKMIEKAEQRGVYDRLVVGDITAELESTQAAYDLIVSADVFIYIGNLAPVFAASGKALKPGGLFAFSVEAGEEGAQYVLRTSGRYAHSMDYVRSLAAGVGLTEVSVEDVVLRKEKGLPMAGHIFLFRA
jgi:predicted TPR repeat methyltransferase